MKDGADSSGGPRERSRAQKGRGGRPTIFDVARVSGVSYSTVSRVVNGHEHIRDETRLRVQAAMAELGYVTHVSARTLATGRSRMVGLLVQEVESPFFLGVIRGVDQQVSSTGYDFLLCTTHDRREKEAEYVARLSHGMVDGLMIILPRGLPDYVGQLRAAAFPFVLIDYDADAPGCNVINAANRDGARAAIRYLLDLGHRRIGFITGTLATGSAQERLLAYRESLAAAGLPFDPSLVVEGDFLEPRGRTAAHELLGRPDPPTAIFASSDAAAFGVLRAARERELDVPGDLSVVGFDDIPEATWAAPVLTTVRQPLREMGRAAARRLMELLDEPGTAPQRVVLDTELIVRASTGPVPATARRPAARRSARARRSVEAQP